jgi:type I site-specific restriction-modification system R (restriction) subunit
MTTKENQIEKDFIAKLEGLKYSYRPDIRDREALENNFRQKFEALNRVHLTDSEFSRLRDEIVSADVFTAAKVLREQNTFQREDGTPLHYTLVNIKDWCKNTFEVINQLRINTDNSHHRYDVILLINGVPVVQVELKALDVSPRRAMQQIVDYKNDPGNGYTNTLLCFVQLFVVSNKTNTWYFANNHRQHFNFDADERFLLVYQFAGEDNQKIAHLDDFAERFLAKCTLGEMVSRYMVLVASEQKLLMMRPYTLRATDDTPFFHHVAMLSELQQASASGKLYTHHFNMLRSILEKTSTFFGFDDFSACIHGVEDEVLYARALNLLSHGKYSAYEPREMGEDTKTLFQNVLNAFLARYRFDLPALFPEETTQPSQP